MRVSVSHLWRIETVVLGLLFTSVFVLEGFEIYQMALFVIYAIAGLGIYLCWGRTGILPLGQSIFFAISAYGVAITLNAFAINSIWAIIPLLIFWGLVVALLAFIIAVMIFMSQIGQSPNFSMITLALAVLAGQVALSWTAVTGGFNGLVMVPIQGIDSFSVYFYVGVLGCISVLVMALKYLEKTPLGLIFSAIQDDEKRLLFLGYKTHVLKGLSFAISAFLAGVAGGIFALHQGIITPQVAGFVFATEVLIWVAIGGRASVVGPIIGAVVVGMASQSLRNEIPWWELLVATGFILVVLYFPNGICQAVSFIFPSRLKPQQMAHPHPPKYIAYLNQQAQSQDLKVTDVDVQMGAVRILEGMSTTLYSGEITCVLGPNGAGKTSLVNAITGNLPVKRGSIQYGDHRLDNKPIWGMIHKGIGRKFQNPTIFTSLTVAENINMAFWKSQLRYMQWLDYRLLQHAPWQAIADFKPALHILKDLHMYAGVLSQGQKQILELILMFISKPDFIMLDEPCAGLGVAETNLVIDLIRAWHKSYQTGFLIVEHDMTVVDKLADKVVVMVNGSLLAEGTLTEIRNNKMVQEVYRGGHK